jgi:hypothetical protein
MRFIYSKDAKVTMTNLIWLVFGYILAIFWKGLKLLYHSEVLFILVLSFGLSFLFFSDPKFLTPNFL